MPVLVARRTAAALGRLMIGTASGAVAVDAETLLVDNGAGQIHRGGIEAGVDNGDRAAAAEVAGALHGIGADQLQTPRIPAAARDVEVDRDHVRIRLQ